MNTFEVIGSFVDSERVDPDVLKDALSTDEGRQYLVDLVALRELTAGDMQVSHVAASSHSTDVTLSSPRVTRSWLRPVAAAAAVVIALAGGYAAGRHATPPAAPPVTTTRLDPSRPPAPTPTSIIKLEPGVDWHEQVTRN